MTDQCLDEVWFEIDAKETGYITWHQVKAFIQRVDVHEVELTKEKEALETARELERTRREYEMSQDLFSSILGSPRNYESIMEDGSLNEE